MPEINRQRRPHGGALTHPSSATRPEEGGAGTRPDQRGGGRGVLSAHVNEILDKTKRQMIKIVYDL